MENPLARRGNPDTPADKVKRRSRARRWVAAALAVLPSLAVALAILNVVAPGETGTPPHGRALSRVPEPVADSIEAPEPVPATLVNAAYRSVAPEMSGAEPRDVRLAHQSVLDPSWASVRVEAPDRDGYYALFLRRSGESWRPERSVLVEEQSRPEDLERVLGDIPRDLSQILLSAQTPVSAETPEEMAVKVVEQTTAHAGAWNAGPVEGDGSHYVVHVKNEKEADLHTGVYVEREDGGLSVVAIGRGLTTTEAPGFPEELARPAELDDPERAGPDSTEAVLDGDVERERVEPGLEGAREAVEDYPGIAGFYVRDLRDGSGYGVRPDEEFFSASVIKVPVMVAVYRRIDEGKLSYGDIFETTREDIVSGSGGLQWEPPGTPQTVEDYLWLMVTQSDNVATNVLVRLVGGRGYVNGVSRSLGAENTVLYQKVSSERAAVPGLDNRTTPRDMSTILQKINDGEAASDESCREMPDLLRQNDREWWIEAGVPPDVEVANKGGWLDSIFNDAGVVELGDRPYALAVFTKYGANDLSRGGMFIKDVSEAVWLAQSGETLREYEKERAEE